MFISPTGNPLLGESIGICFLICWCVLEQIQALIPIRKLLFFSMMDMNIALASHYIPVDPNKIAAIIRKYGNHKSVCIPLCISSFYPSVSDYIPPYPHEISWFPWEPSNYCIICSYPRFPELSPMHIVNPYISIIFHNYIPPYSHRSHSYPHKKFIFLVTLTPQDEALTKAQSLLTSFGARAQRASEQRDLVGTPWAGMDPLRATLC